MIQLVKVIQTCLCAPSQWDAWDADGQYYYLRSRFGRATIERLPGPDTDTWPLPYPSPDILVASWEAEDRQRGGVNQYKELYSLKEFLEHVGGFELAPGAYVQTEEQDEELPPLAE